MPLNAITVAPNLLLPDVHEAELNAHEAEKDKEIASAGRALFLAAFTVIVGSFAAAILISLLHFRF
jgi:hypothetical protein